MAKQTCVSYHVISYIMSCMEILRLFVDLIACCLSLQPLPLPEGDIESFISRFRSDLLRSCFSFGFCFGDLAETQVKQ